MTYQNNRWLGVSWISEKKFEFLYMAKHVGLGPFRSLFTVLIWVRLACD
jgi:hypothetical protein